MKGRVIGIGGIFFKSRSPEKSKTWYSKHLGFVTDQYGACFEWRRAGNTKKHGWTVWSPMKKATKYMNPSRKDFMINLIVDDLDALLKKLKKRGIRQVGKIEEYSYGRFGYVMDPDGIKLELWEPVEKEFKKMARGKTTY